jgi:hypothetical protein
MCIICGDNSHTTMELLQKAITKDVTKKKELPRYKALADLEAEFKRQFAYCVADMSDEIVAKFSPQRL